MKKQFVKLLTVVALFGLAVFSGFFIRNRANTNEPVVLPDGSELRFLGATYGTNHVYKSPLAKISSFLPENLQASISNRFQNYYQIGSSDSSNDSMALWFETVSVTNLNLDTYQLRLVDLEGIESGQTTVTANLFSSAGRKVLPVFFELWPRRLGHFDAVIEETMAQEGMPEIGRFRVANRNPEKSRSWIPESIPITKSVGDIKVTLTHFSSSGTNYANFSSRGDFQLQIDSLQSTNESWRISRVVISDPTGNEMRTKARNYGITQTGIFAPILWPDEDAWKLTVYLIRKTGIPKEDQIAFENIPVPPEGKVIEVNQTNRIHGVDFVMKEFPGEFMPHLMVGTSVGSRFDHNFSSVRLDHIELEGSLDIMLLSTKSENGVGDPQLSGSTSSVNFHSDQLRQIPTNTTSLAFTYAIQKPVKLEFFVAPNWITYTNGVIVLSE